jgi:8-oxo-dGTP diphosphatase
MVRYDTLCYIMNGKQLLMLKKATELFGGGKWNGLGGKMGAGESPEQACIREVHEESGLSVRNLKYHGVLNFWFGNTNEPTITCYVFSTDSFEGQLKESPEGILRWVDFDQVPYEEMWEDDRHWLPMLIEGKSFNGEFHFDQEGTRLLSHKLETF